MAIAIYQETATSRKQWAESTSLSTLRKLASGEWVLFDATPADPAPAPDGLDAATAALFGSPGTLTGTASRALSRSAVRTFSGPALPGDFPPGEYVWMKTDGSGTLLDIVSGVAS